MNRRAFLKRLGISVAAATPVASAAAKAVMDNLVTVSSPRASVEIRRTHTIQEYNWSDLACYQGDPLTDIAAAQAQAYMRARDQEIIEAALGGPDPDAQKGLTLAKLIECKKILDANELPKGLLHLHPSYL